MSNQWGVAIANYDGGGAPNTLTLQPGAKIFNLQTTPGDPAWSSGTDEFGKSGYVPTSYIQKASSTSAANNSSSSSSSTEILPENWTEQTSASNQTYYVNRLTHETQWTIPSSPAKRRTSRKSISALPENWARRSSTTTGRIYYQNKTTGSSQWEHPLRRKSNAQGMIRSSVAETEEQQQPLEQASSPSIASRINSPQRRSSGTPKDLATSLDVSTPTPMPTPTPTTPIPAHNHYGPPSAPPPAHLLEKKEEEDRILRRQEEETRVEQQVRQQVSEP